MRVTRLEIFGFKSFVDRFVLNFDKNRIGIVGPNGCGKSNVVDALRWVLGESHARQLRGSVFDDLIFNGSQSRRPLGMAEVSLTIRPDASWSPANLLRISAPGLDEDVLAPALAPEEVAVLGSMAAAEAGKETGDTLADSGIPNGQADEELSASDQSGADESKTQASSLLDIPGLFDATEIQLTRRLYRSGESEYFINRVSCRLRDMVEFYRIIGLGARGLSIVQQGQISDIINRKPLERRELIEEAAGIAGFRARIEVADRKLERTRDNLARLNDIILEVDKQVRSLARQAKRARDRAELKDRLRELETTLFSARCIAIEDRRFAAASRLEQIAHDVQGYAAELEEVEARVLAFRSELEVCEQDLGQLRLQRDSIMGELTRRQTERSEAELEIARLEGRIRLVESNQRRLLQRREAIGVEIERRKQEFESHKNRQEEVSERRSSAEQLLLALEERGGASSLGSEGEAQDQSLRHQIQELNRELEALPEITLEIQAIEANLKRLRESLRIEQSTLHERKVRIAALESEIRSVENQLQSLADHVKKGTGLESDAEAELTDGKVLLGAIRAPQELQRQLAAILGDRAKYLIASDAVGIAQRYQDKKAQNRGHPNQLGVVQVSGNVGALSQAGLPEISFPRLLDQLDVDSEIRSVMEALIGSVYLVENVTEGLTLASRHPQLIAVTPDGEVATGWGWYATEGKGASFSFARVIETRTEELKIVRAELEASAERVRALEAELQREQEDHRAKTAERERLISAQKEVSRLLQRLQELERKARELFLQEERSAQVGLRRVIEELAATERNMSFELRRIEELRAERDELDSETILFEDQNRALQAEFITAQERLEALMQSHQSGSGEGGENELRNLELLIKEQDGKRSSIRVQLGNVVQEAEELRKTQGQGAAETQELRVQLERCAVEKEMLLEDIRRYYGDDIQFPTDVELEQLRGELTSVSDSISELHREASALRQRLDREGEVDPEAIEQYEVEKQRLDDLEAQYADLEAACKTLTQTISHLTEVSRTRFVATFNAVSEKFSELVPRLFGGGAGQLELVNPEDPLGSGIEIVVRPPGKKVRSLELLSGGEKALTATAIIVAMFLHRPSPVCVLDEVDAPLDDANLARFLDLIREISEKTQFLIITHNKQTMASVDRLIGVTMQESGVSTALTVSIEEAIQEVEQQAVNA